MRDVISLLIGAMALVLGSAVSAASFDCSKGVNQVEQMICSDQTLANLDQSLSQEYRMSVSRSLQPAELKAQQLAWLKNTRDVCLTAECVEVAYRQRLMDLRVVPVIYSTFDVAMKAMCREMTR